MQGGKARGGQVGVGYKGSTEPGSAPPTRDGKPGYVYKLGLKNGLGNVDEYSPIYTPETWKKDGDVYEPGATGLALWAAVLGLTYPQHKLWSFGGVHWSLLETSQPVQPLLGGRFLA